jgi:hypothetical protein
MNQPNLVLRIPDEQRPSRLRCAANVLLRSAGIAGSPPVTAAATPAEAGLVLDGELLLSAAELYHIFATVTLEREILTGRFDRMGMFDENAVTWDVTRPWVDLRARELATKLADRVPFPRMPDSAFRVIVTHDVDRTNFLEPISLLKSILHRFGRYPNWIPLSTAVSPKKWLQNAERLLEIERKHGVGAYYFAISGPYGIRRWSSRCDSHWQSSRRLLRLITQAGMTVGLHGSFYAREEDTYRIEKERLEQVVGMPVTTHRNHYLRFGPLRIWNQLEAAGIRHDFSVGFNYRLGFRAGCAKAYRGFDFRRARESHVFSIPLLFMDAILFEGDRQEILCRLRLALEDAKRVGGCVSVLFHPEMFMIDPQFFRLFEDLLLTCRELGADLSGRLPELPMAPGGRA